MSRPYYRKKNRKSSLIIGMIILAWSFLAVYQKLYVPAQNPAAQQTGTTASATAASGSASVYFLDVGQGDSELIRLPDGTNILIDAGTTETREELSEYLKNMGITKLDILIATHPHEDHIGGMTQVVKDFDIGTLYLPKIAENQTPTTRTYENLLDAAEAKNYKLTQGKAGMTVLDNKNEKLEFVAPNAENYKDLNDYSIVTKFTYGKTSFLFTGDAEAPSEKEILKADYNVKADVLKVGHHGSSSSTSAAFLKAVAPQYAIISCGKDNDYGHPHKEVMNRLQKANVQTYRTDEQGTVLATTDGSKISFQTNQPSLVK